MFNIVRIVKIIKGFASYVILIFFLERIVKKQPEPEPRVKNMTNLVVPVRATHVEKKSGKIIAPFTWQSILRKLYNEFCNLPYYLSAMSKRGWDRG